MYYFSYGSNMASKRLTERGVIPVATVGVGWIDHWRIRFNKRSYKDPNVGYANIEPFWGSRVYGVIYGMREEDMSKLDRFEGYPEHYQRTELAVNWGQFEVLSQYKCVVYIANPLWTQVEPLRVTEEYRAYIDAGMREHVSLMPFTGEYAEEVRLLMENKDETV